MEFRWLALIALWTILAGPALHSPNAASRPRTHVPAAHSAAVAQPQPGHRS